MTQENIPNTKNESGKDKNSLGASNEVLPKANPIKEEKQSKESDTSLKNNSPSKETIPSIENTSLSKDLIKEESIIEIALTDIKSKRAFLESEIKDLTDKKSKLEKELKSTFTGKSDDIARKVKGFQEYLTGALNELAESTAQLELIEQPVIVKPSPLDKGERSQRREEEEIPKIQSIIAVADTFKPDESLIRECLEQFLGRPDFYADPWKLRRSLDSKDLELLEDWFFSMGGRGAQPSRGNRSRNVLISAALISIFGELYGDRFQTLVLASQPERLGEWRRGLQDALGLNREDFGPNSGIVLFERADGLIEKADRLEERGDLPLILIDAAEITVEIPILQFPIWLAFSASPEEIYDEEELIL